MMGKKLEKKRRQFARQNGLCFYCQNPMRLIDGPLPRGTRTPDDIATFEHLDDRYSPERGKHAGSRRVVLAHHLCNQIRGDARTKALPLTERHERSGRRPTTRNVEPRP